MLSGVDNIPINPATPQTREIALCKAIQNLPTNRQFLLKKKSKSTQNQIATYFAKKEEGQFHIPFSIYQLFVDFFKKLSL